MNILSRICDIRPRVKYMMSRIRDNRPMSVKIKDACHERNDATSVIRNNNSNSLMHKMRIVKRFRFHHTQAIAVRLGSYVKISF